MVHKLAYRQQDMLPVLGIIDQQLETDGLLVSVLADELGVKADDILDFDLSLYDVQKAMLTESLNLEITVCK